MILEQANWMRINVPMNLPQQEGVNMKTKLVNLPLFSYQDHSLDISSKSNKPNLRYYVGNTEFVISLGII